MKTIRIEHIVATGLAIFSMLFGAGNLIYPLQVGVESGNLTAFGIFGFLITAVCLPVIGLIAMLLFDGDYQSFYLRLGKPIGHVLLFASIMIIGPILAIPRITTLSHTMIAPFLPTFLQTITPLTSFIFALLFLGTTFLATYRENQIVNILGKYISPILLLSLIIIIVSGFFTAENIVPTTNTAWQIFKTNAVRGYETLDLLGAIFFAAIVLTILKQTIGTGHSVGTLVRVGLQSGIIGVSLLGLVYIGMSMLGAYHGHGLLHINAGELFREISFGILGNYGALLIGTAVLMACLSTSIALSAVAAEYTHQVIFKNSIDYVHALMIVLLACIPLSTIGLGQVLKLTAGPIVYIGYPIIIALTFCNIAYKMWDFKSVKLPVFLAFVVALISYVWF